MRVLLVKLSSLGDVIHALPAVTDAARAIPGLRIDWVVEEAFAEIPSWHSAVERVIPVAIRRWRQRPLRDFTSPEWRTARRQLAQEQYDAIIDAQGLIKSALVARLAQGRRFGMDRASARESLAALAYHERIVVPRDLHAVARIRQLFAESLRYPLPTQAEDFGIREYFAGNEAVSEDTGTTTRQPSLWFLHSTARQEKTWPQSHWAQLCALAAADGYRVVLPWGNELERDRADRIAAASGVASGLVEVAPPLNLQAIAESLVAAQGAVAVDTGLGHLCAALDVPCVSLYGPTSPALVGTCGARQQHLTPPAAAAGMAAIEPPAVWATLSGQWSAPAAHPGDI